MSPYFADLQITTSSLLLLAVLIIMVPAVAYALFTVRGSGISKTPSDGRGEADGSGGAPGAVGPSEEAGVDLGEGSATGSDRHGRSDPQHGTK